MQYHALKHQKFQADAAKAVVDVLSSSIAIVLDAVNNLSDALSSIITIVGTKLAGKAPTKKHPYGYGRIEYLTTVVIAVIVLTAGVTSLKESIEHIIHPETPDYSTVSIIIVSVAVVVKVLLGTYFKKRGKTLDSDSLVASGQDALMDSIISVSTVVAALVFVFFGVSLEAWLGVIISIFILKAGYDQRIDCEIIGRTRRWGTFKSNKGNNFVYGWGPWRLRFGAE